MNPRLRHRAMSFSMSMVNLAFSLLQPVAFDDPYSSNFHAQRLTAQLRHQGELIDPRRRPNVFIISQAAQMNASRADFQGAGEHTAMMLKAVPGQTGSVIEGDVLMFAKKLY